MGYRQMGGDTGRLRQEIADRATLREAISARLRDAGASAVGFAVAEPVDEAMIRTFDDWLAQGRHAGMAYMQNHGEIRRDPRLLLEGARTIISMAFNYTLADNIDNDSPHISAYAYIPDYHYLLRDLIRAAALEELLGHEGEGWRICVDSAPIFERYWARRAGIGTIGANGALSVPGVGSQVFLAEIVTTTALTDEEQMVGNRVVSCIECGRCVRECPSGALQADATIDANRCLSYLTIEHRGDWTDPRHRAAISTDAGRNTLFGCDHCLTCCPLNADTSTTRLPLNLLATITPRDLQTHIQNRSETVAPSINLKSLLKSTPLTRASLQSLIRNASNLTACGD